MGGFLFRCVGLCVFFAALACTESSPKLDPLPTEAEKASQIVPVSKDSFRPQLDILFVIDDSGSMGTHQKNLAANVDLFADAIVKTKYLDYHIGVITSSADGFGTNCCGVLVGFPKFVDRSTPKGLEVLAKNMIVGTSGDYLEQFFDPVEMALTAPLTNLQNKDFYRSDANLALIFITDTEDQSDRNDSRSFYNFLSQLKGGFEKIYIAAAHIPDKQIGSCSGETWELQRLDELANFLAMTNATTFSLCDKNYGEKLAEIGDKIAAHSQVMYLKHQPKQGTIKVTMDGVEMPQDLKKGWSYDPARVAIVFGAEIDWEQYPDGVFPQVDFEINEPIEKKK